MSVSLKAAARWVIFLDVDGVLLPVPKFSLGGGDLDVDCVRRLQKIVESLPLSTEVDGDGVLLPAAGGVSFILSSTWRTLPGMVQRLNDFLVKQTGGVLPPTAGGTPRETVLVSSVTYYADQPSEQRLVRDRVDEIHTWLREHMDDHPEGIGGRWFAIDDMRLDVDERMVGHFLKTTTEEGLCDEDVATAAQLVAALPSPSEAAARAHSAATDPSIINMKLEIEKVLRERAETALRDSQAEISAQKDQIAALRQQVTQLQRSEAEWQRRHEDVSFRLAVFEFAKRIPSLQQAVALAATISGPARREVDQRIKRYVNLLRQRKEVEKKLRAQQKKMKKSTTNTLQKEEGDEGDL